jgi:hypothetical protein
MLKSRVLAVIASTVAFATPLLANAIPAQRDTVRIPHNVSCAQCSVSLSRVATIGDASDPVLLEPNFVLERDSKGRFYAVGHGRGQIVVYDERGKFLHTFGNKGQGPGEFGNWGAREVRVGVGDTIFVSIQPARLLVFSPQFSFVRQVHLPATPTWILPVADGRLVMSASVATPQSRGLPFHLLGNTGVDASFGPVMRNIGAGGVTYGSGLFAAGADGRSIISNTDYSFERWSLEGRSLGVVEVVGDNWLSRAPEILPTGRLNGADYMRALAELPPRNELHFAGQDTDGLLWIVGVFLTGKRSAGGLLESRNIVEVVDVAGKRLLLSQPIPVILHFINGGQLAYSSEIDADGIYRFSVWQAGVKRQ